MEKLNWIVKTLNIDLNKIESRSCDKCSKSVFISYDSGVNSDHECLECDGCLVTYCNDHRDELNYVGTGGYFICNRCN